MELVRARFHKSPALLEQVKCSTRKVVGERKRRGRSESFPSVPLLGLFLLAVRTRKSGHLSCGSSWCSVSGCCLSSPGLIEFLGDGFHDVSVLYALLGPTASVYGTFGRFLWFFLRPLVSGSYLSVLVSPEEVRRFSGRQPPGLFPYSALLVSTVATCSCHFTEAWGFSRSFSVKVVLGP